jgi:hypothetical protein
VIKKFKYLPDLCANFFFINKALKNKLKLSNKGENISLTKGSASINFDKIIKSLDGTVSGIKMVSLEYPTAMIYKGCCTT